MSRSAVAGSSGQPADGGGSKEKDVQKKESDGCRKRAEVKQVKPRICACRERHRVRLQVRHSRDWLTTGNLRHQNRSSTLPSPPEDWRRERRVAHGRSTPREPTSQQCPGRFPFALVNSLPPTGRVPIFTPFTHHQQTPRASRRAICRQQHGRGQNRALSPGP